MSTLTPEKWLEVSPYLDQALSLSDEERIVWLEALQKEKPELVRLLQSLLEEHRAVSSEHFLENEVVSGEASLQGRQLGSYTLISALGRGGMGSVWLAERSDGRFERRVAVKFLHFSVAAHGGVERFKREGRILGQLSHPNIAELIDAGVTATGEPYLVLEHVDGLPIHGYCDQNKLDVNARIRLFLDVLSAVGQAHASLVVHRDLKPSNVLVRKDGTVKLLDFGIAKLLADEITPAAATQLTLDGGSALTPLFAAPEQITGAPITTATDVYALGALLYLLLTGRNPTGAQHSPAELFKAVAEIEPRRPSEAIASINENQVAEERGSTPEKLRRQLRGDLDTILSKTLKKNPAERYGSVSALAEDLRRYLGHEPISARPDTFTYRVRQFVRRNRLAVALSSAAMVAVLAGIAGTLSQARTARRQRDFAFRQLTRAERVNELNWFLLSDAEASGAPVSVSDLLQRAEQIVEREDYSKDPANHVELLLSLADQYWNAGNYVKHRQFADEAYQLSGRLNDVSLRARAACELGSALVDQAGKDNARAEALVQDGLRELPDAPEFAMSRVFCLWKGSDLSATVGKSQEAIQRDEMAQQILSKSTYYPGYLRLELLGELGRRYEDTQLDRAIDSYQQAIALEKELGYDDTKTMSNTYGTLAWLLTRAGRPLEAERYHRMGMDIIGKKNLKGWALQAYAAILRELNRIDEAAQYAEEAVSRAKAANNTVAEIQALTTLGRIRRDQRNFEAAKSLFAETEDLMRRHLSPNHFWFAMLASERSLLAEAEGKSAVALQLADSAVAIDEETIKTDAEGAGFLPRFLYRRAALEFETGDLGKAQSDLERAIGLLRDSLGKDALSVHFGECYMTEGRILERQQKPDEARAAFRLAVTNFQKALGPDHPETVSARQLAGSVAKN
jgi:serine/threonine-protein kinase